MLQRKHTPEPKIARPMRTFSFSPPLVALMLALAGLNRWRLTPALERGTPQQATRHLRLSLTVETIAALAIIGLVAWLGTLDPLG